MARELYAAPIRTRRPSPTYGINNDVIPLAITVIMLALALLAFYR